MKFSTGNSKMGQICSVSLPAGKTCRNAPCFEKCYARKIERLRKTVRDAYQHNYEVLQNDPETYWREVRAQLMLSRFFRFHVSGDIPDADYLDRMVEASRENPHCEVLCFTKQYNLVNDFIRSGGKIPKNLHIVFSAWVGLPMVNPFAFPEAHVRYRNGTTTAKDSAKECGGNCSECARTGEGCWTLKTGEQVVFREH